MEEHDTLTKKKLLEILWKVEGNQDVEILSCSVQPGTEKGENYASEMLRCDLTAIVGKEEKDYHWMVKLEPVLTEFTKGMHLEEKEITYYKELMPKWNLIAEEKKASFRITNLDSPFAELGEKGKRSILVMENLCHHGYTDAPNKKKGLSLDHIKVALEELARFHSLGYVYLKSYPNGLEEGRRKNEVFITDYMTAETASGAQVLFKRLSDEIINTVGLIQEPGQDFVSIYQRFRDENDPYKFIQRLLRAKPDAFNVICHGDVWFNNMLFKHDADENPVKAVLLDVSVCNWTSPAADLTTFLYSSTTPMLRATHLAEMLGHYHDALIRCLWELGEDPVVYPYRQLMKDFNDHAFIGFWFAMIALPMVLAKKEDAVGQEVFSGDPSDPDRVEEMSLDARKKMEQAIRNEPQIKVMLGGTFLDMMKRGIFKP